MGKKAVIAMSGGVDSSVAALLMLKKGYDCRGVTMLLHGGENIADAEKVCQRLNMPFSVMDFKSDFEKYVINDFISCYENGKTPNPCVECNRELKFGRLMEVTKNAGGDFLVTGHYAKTAFDENSGRYLLKKAEDSQKDQSYFLYMLTQEQLSRVAFPLGEFTKPQIRRIAEENGFVNAAKKDSQDICFVPGGDYAAFIEDYTKKRFPKGFFTDKNGNVMGEHKGIIHYTVGQRKGLGAAFGKPVYVCGIDPCENRVILGENEDLFTDTVTADSINIISKPDIFKPVRVSAKIRYRHNAQPALAWQTEEGLLKVKFDEPQRAVTKGQSVVLYDGDTVVGGGKII